MGRARVRDNALLATTDGVVAVRKVVYNYFNKDVMRKLVAPLIGNPLINKVESANGINCRFNPKRGRLSALQYLRGAAFAYMDTGTQWLASNGKADCPPKPWQEVVLRKCATALSLPPAILAMDPISTEKVTRRITKRAARTGTRSSEESRIRRAAGRKAQRLGNAGKLRAKPAPYVAPEELQDKGYGPAEYIGKGGGIIMDKGKELYVVTDKVPTSRASKPIGSKKKSSSMKTLKELSKMFFALLKGQKWNAKFGKHIGWADPSKLEAGNGRLSIGSKGYVLSQITALQMYYAQITIRKVTQARQWFRVPCRCVESCFKIKFDEHRQCQCQCRCYRRQMRLFHHLLQEAHRPKAHRNVAQ